MAVFGQSPQLFNMLGLNLLSDAEERNNLTLEGYLKVGFTYPGGAIVNYLIDSGVPKEFTFGQLMYASQFYNYITDAMRMVSVIDSHNKTQNFVDNYGQDSGADVAQHGMSIEPQNKFMSYKPTNESVGDAWDMNGQVNYPPVSWTDSNGDFHTFELRYVQSVLADGTLIFEAYDTNYGDYYWVAMRRSAHNSKNLEFVDALVWTNQFDSEGYDYTIKNSENSVTFFTYTWSLTGVADVISWTTTLSINNKGKLSAVDKELLIGSNGILGLYNEVTSQSYIDFSVSNNRNPITTFNDDFNQLMNGSKLGTFYFFVDQVDDGGGGGLVPVDKYENILAVNFLTGTYELINAVTKLQDAVDVGHFNNDWGVNISNAFDDFEAHPEGILFSLSDGFSRDNGPNLNDVTRVWSPEWSNYLNPVPLTTRNLDDVHSDNNGTYSSYSGYIFNDDSDDYWNLSPKHLHVFYNVITDSGYVTFDQGQVVNYIYRFELNPETYNNEPELQSVSKSTGIKYPILSDGPGGPVASVGTFTNSSTYQFPTNNGMAFSNSGSYYFGNNQAYGSFELNYWNGSSNNPVALGSNLGRATNYTNNTVIQTVSSYSSYYYPYTVYPVNVDQYKGVNFGL